MKKLRHAFLGQISDVEDVEKVVCHRVNCADGGCGENCRTAVIAEAKPRALRKRAQSVLSTSRPSVRARTGECSIITR